MSQEENIKNVSTEAEDLLPKAENCAEKRDSAKCGLILKIFLIFFSALAICGCIIFVASEKNDNSTISAITKKVNSFLRHKEDLGAQNPNTQISMSEKVMRCGAYTNWFEPTGEHEVPPEIIKAIAEDLGVAEPDVKPIKYRTQVVSGVNHGVVVEVSEKIYEFTIYQHWSQEIKNISKKELEL